MAPEPGAAARVVAREQGFAIKVLRPLSEFGPTVPPGQGQLLIPLRGSLEVDEPTDNETKVTQTARHARSARLLPGQLWRVANDATWRLRSLDDAVILQISTSVPREVRGVQDLLADARRRAHMGPARVFGNEVLRVETSTGRVGLPGLGWVPWDHVAEGVEYAIGLAGAWRARLRVDGAPWLGRLEPGHLLRIDPGVAHNFAARSMRPAVGLIVTSLRRVPTGAVSRDAVRGFSPFVDRG